MFGVICKERINKCAGVKIVLHLYICPSIFQRINILNINSSSVREPYIRLAALRFFEYHTYKSHTNITIAVYLLFVTGHPLFSSYST